MAGLSKLNSVTRPEGEVEVDIVPGESVYLDGPKAIKRSRGESRATIHRTDAYRSKSSGIP